MNSSKGFNKLIAIFLSILIVSFFISTTSHAATCNVTLTRIDSGATHTTHATGLVTVELTSDDDGGQGDTPEEMCVTTVNSSVGCTWVPCTANDCSTHGVMTFTNVDISAQGEGTVTVYGWANASGSDACDNSGTAQPTDTIVWDKTDPTAPSDIALNPVATYDTDADVTWTWTNNGDNVTANGSMTHNLKACENNDCATDCTASSAFGAGATTGNIAGLTDNTTYYGCVQAEDEAGLTSSFVASGATITIDQDADAPTVDDADSTSTSSTVTWTWSAPADEPSESGVAQYNYKACTNSGCTTDCVGSGSTADGVTLTANIGSLVNGSTYYGCVQTQDNAGNTSSWDASTNTTTIDTTAPTAPAFTLYDNDEDTLTTHTNSTTVRATAASCDADISKAWVTETDSGVTAADIDTNGTACATALGTMSGTVAAGDGTKTLYLWVRDTAGNIDSTPTSNTIELDQTNPTSESFTLYDNDTAATDISDSTTVRTTLTTCSDISKVYLTETDSGVTAADIEASGQACSTVDYAITGTAAGEGTATFYLWVRDTAGNIDSTPASDSILVDTSPPTAPAFTLYDDDDDANSTYSDSTTVRTTVSDCTDIEKVLLTETAAGVTADDINTNGTACTTTAYAISGTAVADGTRTFYLWAVDAADNTNSAQTPPTDTIIVDTTNPNPPTVNDAATPSSIPTVTWTWSTGTDNVSADADISYKLKACTDTGCSTGCLPDNDGSDIAANTLTGDVSSLLAQESYYGCVRSVDEAGHMSDWDASTSATLIDTPYVTEVYTNLADGSYNDIDDGGEGNTVDIIVKFSKTVDVVGGPPQLTLNTDTNSVVDCDTGLNAVTEMTCTYTITDGDDAADLDYASTSALALNGASIYFDDTVAATADLTLATPGQTNSISDDKAIVIDTTHPTFAGITGFEAYSLTSIYLKWTEGSDNFTTTLDYNVYYDTDWNVDADPSGGTTYDGVFQITGDGSGKYLYDFDGSSAFADYIVAVAVDDALNESTNAYVVEVKVSPYAGISLSQTETGGTTLTDADPDETSIKITWPDIPEMDANDKYYLYIRADGTDEFDYSSEGACSTPPDISDPCYIELDPRDTGSGGDVSVNDGGSGNTTYVVPDTQLTHNTTYYFTLVPYFDVEGGGGDIIDEYTTSVSLATRNDAPLGHNGTTDNVTGEVTVPNINSKNLTIPFYVKDQQSELGAPDTYTITSFEYKTGDATTWTSLDLGKLSFTEVTEDNVKYDYNGTLNSLTVTTPFALNGSVVNIYFRFVVSDGTYTSDYIETPILYQWDSPFKTEPGGKQNGRWTGGSATDTFGGCGLIGMGDGGNGSGSGLYLVSVAIPLLMILLARLKNITSRKKAVEKIFKVLPFIILFSLITTLTTYSFAEAKEPPGRSPPQKEQIIKVYKKGVGAPIGTIKQSKGILYISHKGDDAKLYVASKGIKVYEGDKLITKDNSRARVVMKDGSLVALSSNSIVEVTKAKFFKNIKVRQSIFTSIMGKARYVITKFKDFKKSDVKVKSPSAVAGVRGSDFVVNSTPGNTNVMTLKNTTVDVSGKGKTERLKDFQKSSVKKGNAPSKPKKLTPEDIKNIEKDFDMKVEAPDPEKPKPDAKPASGSPSTPGLPGAPPVGGLGSALGAAAGAAVGAAAGAVAAAGGDEDKKPEESKKEEPQEQDEELLKNQVSGFVFVDKNSSKTFDPHEYGISQVEVFLVDGEKKLSAITDHMGKFIFTPLVPPSKNAKIIVNEDTLPTESEPKQDEIPAKLGSKNYFGINFEKLIRDLNGYIGGSRKDWEITVKNEELDEGLISGLLSEEALNITRLLRYSDDLQIKYEARVAKTHDLRVNGIYVRPKKDGKVRFHLHLNHGKTMFTYSFTNKTTKETLNFRRIFIARRAKAKKTRFLLIYSKNLKDNYKKGKEEFFRVIAEDGVRVKLVEKEIFLKDGVGNFNQQLELGRNELTFYIEKDGKSEPVTAVIYTTSSYDRKDRLYFQLEGYMVSSSTSGSSDAKLYRDYTGSYYQRNIVIGGMPFYYLRKSRSKKASLKTYLKNLKVKFYYKQSKLETTGTDVLGQEQTIKASPTTYGLQFYEFIKVPYFNFKKFKIGPSLAYESYNLNVEDETMIYRNNSYTAIKPGVVMMYPIESFQVDVTFNLNYVPAPLYMYSETPDIGGFKIKSKSHMDIDLEFKKTYIKHIDFLIKFGMIKRSVTYENGENASDSITTYGAGVRFWF